MNVSLDEYYAAAGFATMWKPPSASGHGPRQVAVGNKQVAQACLDNLLTIKEHLRGKVHLTEMYAKSAVSKRPAWMVIPTLVSSYLMRFFNILARLVLAHRIPFLLVFVAFGTFCGLSFLLLTESIYDSDELWNPTDLQGYQDRKQLKAIFPHEGRAVQMLFDNGGGNLLTKAFVLELFDIGFGLDLRHKFPFMCNRPHPTAPCPRVSILSAWGNDRSRIEADPDVFGTLNRYLLTTTSSAERNSVSGFITPGTQNLSEVFSVVETWVYKSDPKKDIIDIEKGILDDYSGWVSSEGVRVIVVAPSSVGAEVARVVEQDVLLVVISIVLVILFCGFLLGDGTIVGNRLLLGTVGAALMLVSYVFGVGLLGAAGEHKTPATPLVLFVLIGIGVDDVIIIVDCYNANFYLEDRRKRMMQSLSTSGPAITLTTVTDILAFGVGTMATMPAVRNFTLTALLVIVFDFILQTTIFLIALDIDQMRINANRIDLLPCLQVEDRYLSLRDFIRVTCFKKKPRKPARVKSSQRNSVIHVSHQVAVSAPPVVLPPSTNQTMLLPEHSGGVHIEVAAPVQPMKSPRCGGGGGSDAASRNRALLSEASGGGGGSASAAGGSDVPSPAHSGAASDVGPTSASSSFAPTGVPPPSPIPDSLVGFPQPSVIDEVSVGSAGGSDLASSTTSTKEGLSPDCPPVPGQNGRRLSMAVLTPSLAAEGPAVKKSMTKKKLSFLTRKVLDPSVLEEALKNTAVLMKDGSLDAPNRFGGEPSAEKPPTNTRHASQEKIQVCSVSDDEAPVQNTASSDAKAGGAGGGIATPPQNPLAVRPGKGSDADGHAGDNAKASGAVDDNYDSSTDKVQQVRPPAPVVPHGLHNRRTSKKEGAKPQDSPRHGHEHGHGHGLDSTTPTCSIGYFIERYYGPAITSFVGRFLVVLAFFGLAAFNITRIPQLEQGLSSRDTLPSDSYVTEFYDLQEKYFKSTPTTMTVVIESQGLDWTSPKTVEDILLLQSMLETEQSIVSFTPWYLLFLDHVHRVHGMHPGDPRWGVAFAPLLHNYMELYPYVHHQLNFISLEGNASIIIKEVMFTGKQRVHDKSSVKIKDMQAARAAFNLWSQLTGKKGYISARWYAFTDADRVISTLIGENLTYSGCAVLFALLFFMPPLMAVLVTATVGLIDLSILGWMWVTSVNMSAVSYIVIAMSIGLSVDYCAHIAIAFTNCRLAEDSESRKRGLQTAPHYARLALNEIGGSVLAGGSSTLLGVLALAFASSQTFLMFFKMLFAAVMFGMLHGFVFFPAMLACLPRWFIRFLVIDPL